MGRYRLDWSTRLQRNQFCFQRSLCLFCGIQMLSIAYCVISGYSGLSQKWVIRVLLGNVLRLLSQVHAIWRFILCVPPLPTRITQVYYFVLVLHGLFGEKGRSQPWKCFFCGKLLEASSMPGKINWGLALTIGMLLSQLEKLVTPLWGHIKKGKNPFFQGEAAAKGPSWRSCWGAVPGWLPGAITASGAALGPGMATPLQYGMQWTLPVSSF